MARSGVSHGKMLPSQIPARSCTKIAHMETIAELQETEVECLRRFRKRASEIQAAHPEMTPQICFARAVQALPKTADRYQYARQRLMFAGFPALPLR